MRRHHNVRDITSLSDLSSMLKLDFDDLEYRNLAYINDPLKEDLDNCLLFVYANDPNNLNSFVAANRIKKIHEGLLEGCPVLEWGLNICQIDSGLINSSAIIFRNWEGIDEYGPFTTTQTIYYVVLDENDDYDYNVILITGAISLLRINPELYTTIDNMLDPGDADKH